MKGLLTTKYDRASITLGHKLTLCFLIYVPAVLYRWNLKASAWLWWPVALVMTSPFQGKSDAEKVEASAVTTNGFWSSKREWFAYAIGAWLLVGQLPSDQVAKLNFLAEFKTATKLSEWITPPPLVSLRFWLFALCAALIFWLHKQAVDLRAIGVKHNDGIVDPAETQRSVKRIAALEKLRLCTIAVCVLTGWIFGLWVAQKQWPQLFQSMMWRWLLPWL